MNDQLSLPPVTGQIPRPVRKGSIWRLQFFVNIVMFALLVLADGAGNPTFSVYPSARVVVSNVLGGLGGNYTKNIGFYGIPEGLISSGFSISGG